MRWNFVRPRRLAMCASLCLCAVATLAVAAGADEFAVPLTGGASAVWDLRKAVRETTPTRERVCINGLWRWQPASDEERTQPPSAAWGYFKVPGFWPGITDYMQKESQTLFVHPAWQEVRLTGVSAAWYEREITIPEEWTEREIRLSVETLNSFAAVFIDGLEVGEIRFPGGELQLTESVRPGGKYRLSLLVVALPQKETMMSFRDSAAARPERGSVARRGLCGDLFLVSIPKGPRVADLRVETSVREGRIALDVGLEGLQARQRYSLSASIMDQSGIVKEWTGAAFQSSDLVEGRRSLSTDWKAERLWDLHTPENQYMLRLVLKDEADTDAVCDVTWDERFGFREFRVEGRDFYLNGSRIFLSAVPIDNALISASAATYRRARETFERLKSIGINFVYTHNYGCEPGTHLSWAEVLRAADDAGVLVSYSLPHFGQYDWEDPRAELTNGYARHAREYIRRAGNHPSIVFYSMSHNATGYSEDMNPAMFDGLQEDRDNWARNNARRALRAESIARGIDPGRLVYHHASGNLGVMHSSNFYPNFVPIQELSDWFEHWSSQGVKPAFLCEYGAPFTWDWTMYRGWYQGKREFGSARVPWEFCLAEWNAQFIGDKAYRISEMEADNLRWEAKQFQRGSLWHRWDYPHQVGSDRFDVRHDVIGRYLTDNFRAYRTWGVSGISPWEYGHFWRLRERTQRGREDLAVDWDALQRPGFSADFIDQEFERMDVAYDREDWVPTADGQAVLRNNLPVLAYIGGKPGAFTSKDHNFRAGELLTKQLILINNSREEIWVDCSWDFDLAGVPSGRQRVTVPTGAIEMVPVEFELSAAGRYTLSADFTFSSGAKQTDRFQVDVLPQVASHADSEARIALFDPVGETAKLLRDLGIGFEIVDAAANLDGFDLLIIGKKGLSLDGEAPSLKRVPEGLKVVLFEQEARVLERRLGFRVVEYGLRQVWPRIAGHPALETLGVENLADWTGSGTLVPENLDYTMRPMHGPTVEWSGIPVTRAWRRGSRGTVASVLIEKPARGDFLPIVDGGYSLQYSPLLAYREGRGMVLFCQLDVTGRTERDPAAETVARNVIDWAAGWIPAASRRVVYAGEPAGMAHLEKAGFEPIEYSNAVLSQAPVLVIGPGGSAILKADGPQPLLTRWLEEERGRLVALGLDGKELAELSLPPIQTVSEEHIAAYFESGGPASPLAGVGPADVHNRDPRPMPLVQSGATVVGDGVLAYQQDPAVVYCQVVPWQFEPDGRMNIKRTYRRASFILSRILSNLEAASASPLLKRFADPVSDPAAAGRWLDGFYLDEPEEWDDPYRFFRW